ncbi:23 kDa integral membrane protein-like [Gambusia affinis]|uniref:23 kDa integral membrane protein-like n=1 Tax=Gambusia affinis TaxID=33528 RepID=UPI001CDD7C10|nr:23 kDa integral membrane protein-like [Gambusia affinis]XP_043964155.1 23 kDa integral membrane protein-like [Gambusia affinis]
MGKVNFWLKLVFILFNVFFMVLGFMMIYVSVKSVSSNYKVSGFNGIDLLKVWVFALIILFIAGLGIYAAIAENNIALKIFAGLTVFMMVIYLVMGVLFTIYREVITDYFNKSDKELMNLLINGTQSEGIQREGKCCGVLRAEDWGTKIPESCKCTATGPDLKSKCKPRPQGTEGPDLIFSQSCKNLFLMAVRMVPTVAMALFYGFVCIEVLLLALSFLLIHQIKKSDSGRSFT